MPDADADAPDFHMLPENLQRLIEAVGFPSFKPNAMDEEETAIYDRVRNGRCMTCNQTLGEDANFIVTRYGIVAGYCNGMCHTDMAVLGYLQTEHGELSDRIRFREGVSADEPEA